MRQRVGSGHCPSLWLWGGHQHPPPACGGWCPGHWRRDALTPTSSCSRARHRGAVGEGRGSGEVRSLCGAMAGPAPAQVGFRKGPGPLLSRLAARSQLELVLCAVAVSLAVLLGIAVVALAIQYRRGREGHRSPAGAAVASPHLEGTRRDGEGQVSPGVLLPVLCPPRGAGRARSRSVPRFPPAHAHSPGHAFPARSLSQHLPDGCLCPGGQQDPGGTGCRDGPMPGLLPVLVRGLDQEEPTTQRALQVEHLQQHLGPEPGHHEASPRWALGDMTTGRRQAEPQCPQG